jgi:prepilin-type processing-associated H-X9-DG protein
VIHPHDRARVAPSASGGRSSALAQARRSTAERLLGDKGHKRSGSYGDSPEKSNAAFLDGSVITTPRNSRWVPLRPSHTIMKLDQLKVLQNTSNTMQDQHSAV